ncbi:hypothetical protein IC229_32450 [Spirosoma sp. BT702]|uniref:Uncharacterized protein n=1 Tax=Spirosoma profusum TaxID=2771354 RepID=A0A927AVY1_9BACT|nr:hypothetical protein [Spirosoma profusum]MBD2705371.1 hypothetical protein [Spirosoma profusum]
MDRLILSQEQVERLYDEIKHYPALISTLSDYERSKIKVFANLKLGLASAVRERLQKEVYDDTGGCIGTQQQLNEWLTNVSLEDDATKVLRELTDYEESINPKQQQMNEHVTIDQIIAKRREKLSYLLSDENTNLLYAPFPKVWKGSVEEMKVIEKTLRQSLINSLNSAWAVSEEWVKDFRQEAIQQPHDIDNIFNAHFSHYKNLTNQYKPFNRWALEYWPEPVKPDSKYVVNGLWRELFDLCYTNNVEMGVAFDLVEIVFSANLTVAKLSRDRVNQSALENAVDELGLSITKNAQNINDDKLTDREKALIHCYKGLPPISRGEPLYNKYIALATPKKRISYPNDSIVRAKRLIASIEKILPMLDEFERKQAENEINTIWANFSN